MRLHWYVLTSLGLKKVSTCFEWRQQVRRLQTLRVVIGSSSKIFQNRGNSLTTRTMCVRSIICCVFVLCCKSFGLYELRYFVKYWVLTWKRSFCRKPRKRACKGVQYVSTRKVWSILDFLLLPIDRDNLQEGLSMNLITNAFSCPKANTPF